MYSSGGVSLYSDDGDGALVARCPLSLGQARPPRSSATIHTATIHRMPQLGPQQDDSTLGKTRMIKWITNINTKEMFWFSVTFVFSTLHWNWNMYEQNNHPLCVYGTYPVFSLVSFSSDHWWQITVMGGGGHARPAGVLHRWDLVRRLSDVRPGLVRSWAQVRQISRDECDDLWNLRRGPDLPSAHPQPSHRAPAYCNFLWSTIMCR